MFLPTLNPIEPPWYGPVCPVVWEGWRREASPYPDLRRILPVPSRPPEGLLTELTTDSLVGGLTVANSVSSSDE